MSIANIVHRTEGSPAERYATAREFVTKRAEDLGLDPQVLVRLLDAKELKAIDALLASSSAGTTASGQTNGSLRSDHFTSMPPAWVQASTESATRLERVLERYSTPVREHIEKLSAALVLDEPELEKALNHPGLRPSSSGQTIVPPRYLLDALAAITGRSVTTGASAPLDLKTVIGVRSWLDYEHGTPTARKLSARFIADARHPETRTKLADSIASLTPKLKSFVLNQVRSIALRLTEVAPTYKDYIASTLNVVRDAVHFADFVREADGLAADGKFGAAFNLLSWVREAGEDYSGVNAAAYSTLHALQTGHWADAVLGMRLARKAGLDELAVVLEDSNESQPVVVEAELLRSLESDPHTRVYAEGLRKLGESTPGGVVLRIDYPTTSPNDAIHAGMQHIPQALLDAAHTFNALNARLDAKAKASAPAAPPSGLESALQESRRVLEGECDSFLKALRFEGTEASSEAIERVAIDNNVVRQGQEVTVKLALEELYSAAGSRGWSSLGTIRATRDRASFVAGSLNIGQRHRADHDESRRAVYHEFGHAMMEEDPEAESTCLAWVQQRATGERDISAVERNPNAQSYAGDFPFPYMGKTYPPMPGKKNTPNGPRTTEVVSVALEHFRSPRALAALIIRELQCSAQPEATALTVWALKKRTKVV